MEMITDAFYKWRQSTRKLFCHHEYVYHSVPYFLEFIGYYECKKCGRVTCNLPESLVIHNDY